MEYPTVRMLIARRVKTGWTQEQLAEEMGVSAGALARYERKTRTPKPYRPTMDAWVAALERAEQEPRERHLRGRSSSV